MKPRTVVMLLTLLVICAGFLIVNRIDCRRDIGDERSRRLFPELDADVRAIRIQPATGNAVELSLADGTPRITTPVTAPAGKDRLQRLAGNLRDMTYTRVFNPNDAEGLGDSQTGLDKPRLTLTFATADGKSHTVRIGRQAPRLGTGITETYVRPDDSPQTFVVALDLGAMFPADANHYRDMTMLNIPGDRIYRIRVEGRDAYTLEGDDGHWAIVEPTSTKVKSQSVDQLIQRIAHVKAERILNENATDLRPYGLDKPQLAITVYVLPPVPASETDGKPVEADIEPPAMHTLLLGNERQDEVCAKLADQPVVFTLPKRMLEDLGPRLADIRSMSILDITPDRVEEITVNLATGETFKLLRDGDGWKFALPAKGPADAERVQSLLDDLAGLKVTNWIDGDRPMDIPMPTATFTLQLDGLKEKEATLTVGGKDPGGTRYVVRSSQANVPALVAVGDVVSLLAGLEHYWLPRLTSIDENERIVELSLKRQGGTVDLVRLTGGYWRLTSPVKDDADKQRVQAALEKLRNLVAAEIVYVGKGLPSRYADAAEQVRATMTVKPISAEDAGAAPRSLVVHAGRVDGETFAWIQRDGAWAVGRCDADVYDVLNADMQQQAGD